MLENDFMRRIGFLEMGLEEVRNVLGEGFSVEDVRDYFFRVYNPGVYGRGGIPRLVFPFRVYGVEGGRVYGVLWEPFFDVPETRKAVGFNSCSIRSACERGVFVGAPSEGVIITHGRCIVDYMREDDLKRYDDLYGRES
jgi:hypothetical protein